MNDVIMRTIVGVVVLAVFAGVVVTLFLYPFCVAAVFFAIGAVCLAHNIGKELIG